MSAAVRRVALLAIFVAGACSVPERDNPFDPTRRPEAVLRVVTPEGGRGTPFVFDASSSRDPRDRGPLRFEWEIHDERYDTLPDDDGFDDFEDDTGDTIQVSFPNPFPLAFLSTNGEGSIARRVRVKVIAADGAYDIAEGTVVVREKCMIRLRWSINDATIGDAILDEWTIPVDSFIEGFAVAP